MAAQGREPALCMAAQGREPALCMAAQGREPALCMAACPVVAAGAAQGQLRVLLTTGQAGAGAST
jgi:hypothetical protein